MEPYLFADAGIMVQDSEFEHISALRMDAGIGSAFTWKWFGPLETVKPVTLRVDLPLFLNKTPFEDGEYFRMRYVIGINRAF